KKPYLCNFSAEDASGTALQLNQERNNREKIAVESKPQVLKVAPTPHDKIKEPFPKYVDCKIYPDSKMSAFQQSCDFPCSSKTADVRLNLQSPLEIQQKLAKEILVEMNEQSVLNKDTEMSEKTPLDLSEKSTRADSSFTSTLQAALIIHRCPYCSHKTYYPEVLWMHKRIWHKVSCNSMAPAWVLQNGFKSIKHNSVFMARSGRTGPPPVLGGKECQPLPIARFTRTQVPTRGYGKRCTIHWGCGPQPSAVDGYRPPKLNHTHEQYGTVAQQPQLKSKLDVNSKLMQTGNFSRNSTPSHTVISKPSGHPSSSRETEKYIVPQVNAGSAPLIKHCTPDTGKAKFLSPSQYHPLCKTEPCVTQEPPSMPQQERTAKRESEMRALINCTGGSRASPLMQPQPVAAGPPPPVHSTKQEPSPEGHEKCLDIVNILKTSIPKDLATFYQTWGANSPVMDRAGMLRTQTRQGDYLCVECGKGFTQPSHLRTHMRSHTVVFESNGLRGTEVHTTSADAPKQSCEYCSANNEETGERPFQCRYCPYSASQKGNLKTHVQCVHQVPFDNSQYPDLRFPSPPNNYSINPLEGQLENIFTISPVPGATVL
ncbi:hypothetical protein E2320_011193, partial [Naja naja]